MPQLEDLVDDDEQVWLGGPVQPNAVLVLGEFVDPDDAAVPLFGSLGFPALDEPEEILPATTRRRVFAGYAGWGAGRSRTSSRTRTGSSSRRSPTMRSPRSRGPLARLLRRKGGIYELVARMPDDPSVN